MARQPPYPYPIPLLGSTGLAGALLTQPSISLENVGDSNFSAVLDFRRVTKDQLGRREGWVKFVPNAGDPVDQQYIFDGTLLLNRLAELVRGDGSRVIVGASATTIKMFDPVADQWTVIGTGYSSSGARWQAEVLNNYLILNNAVDLPCSYVYGGAAVAPLYELREVGVSCCGRIKVFNGFLFLGDVTIIKADQLNAFMYGYQNFTPTNTSSENASFTAGSTTAYLYNATTGASNITATLPATQPPLGWWTIIKKVDAGAGTVVTLPVIGDETVTLAALNDLAIIWSDGTLYHAKFFASGVVPAPAPYGIPPSDIVQEHPDMQAWGTFGDPTNWAPIVDVYVPSASATLTLPFVPHNWVPGTLMAVIGGGPSGGVLGGQSNYPDGVPILSISGNTITLAESTDSGITYPTVVQVVRFADTASFAGNYSYGDGLRIRAMTTSRGQLVSYRDGSIEIARYTTVVATPFAFRNIYVGENVPVYGDCVISVNGDYDLYPTVSGNFYKFDGLTEPEVHALCDNAKDIFFGNISPSFSPWAIDNPLTKEIWFCTEGVVMAYDYLYGTVAEMSQQVDSAVLCQKPGSADKWFILGIDQQAGGSNVYTYALVGKGGTAITTYFRDGVNPGASLTSGLISVGDQMNEKIIVSYTPLLSSPSPNLMLEIQLLGTFDPNVAPTTLMVGGQEVPDANGNNFITMAYQSLYFQDVISITDTRDVDCRLSGRMLEYIWIGASGVTRD